MKKTLKIFSFVLVFVLALAPAIVFAAPEGLENIQAETPDAIVAQAGIVNTIMGAIQWIGYAVAVVVVLWMGIQWMLAQPAKKAELKGKMWSVAIGVILLVAGVTILNVVWDLGQNVETTVSQG